MNLYYDIYTKVVYKFTHTHILKLIILYTFYSIYSLKTIYISIVMYFLYCFIFLHMLQIKYVYSLLMVLLFSYFR